MPTAVATALKFGKVKTIITILLWPQLINQDSVPHVQKQSILK